MLYLEKLKVHVWILFAAAMLPSCAEVALRGDGEASGPKKSAKNAVFQRSKGTDGGDVAREKERIAEALRLMAQLGGDDFKTREAAQKRLLAMPPSVLTTVKAAVKESSDPEVKLRGEIVIQALERKASTLAFPAQWAKGVQQLTNTIGMNLVLIPSGEFMMGSPKDEEGRREKEGPRHQVTLTKPYYMGATEVTQAQWKEVMGNNPSQFKGDDLPVENVSWDDAQKFLSKLSAKEGKTYRLPTEAEWEFAARAGTSTRFHFGDDETKLDDYAWYDNNSGEKTHPVAGKKPNAWGLYDMHGNVWEWCQDWYGEKYYDKSPKEDPAGPAQGIRCVVRSGSWRGSIVQFRCAFRLGGGAVPATVNTASASGLCWCRRPGLPDP